MQKGGRGLRPIIDGWYIREDLSIAFAQGRQHEADVLVGSNKDEGSFILRGPTADQWTSRVRGRWDDLADAYLNSIRLVRTPKPPDPRKRRFAMRCSGTCGCTPRHRQSAGTKRTCTISRTASHGSGQARSSGTHTAEIPYVFNNLAPVRVFPDGSSPALASASSRDRSLAETISSVLGEFCAQRRPQRQRPGRMAAIPRQEHRPAHDSGRSG